MNRITEERSARKLLDQCTPGPWALAVRGGEQSHDSVWPDRNESEYRICVVERTDEHPGDARLIAAAPELAYTVVKLYEALAAARAEVSEAARAILANRAAELAAAREEGRRAGLVEAAEVCRLKADDLPRHIDPFVALLVAQSCYDGARAALLALAAAPKPSPVASGDAAADGRIGVEDD